LGTIEVIIKRRGKKEARREGVKEIKRKENQKRRGC